MVESLIERAEQQPELFEVEQRVQAMERDSNPTFTAARYFTMYPDRYKEITRMLAEPGVSTVMLARIFACSTHTIDAIRDREQPRIAEQKEGIALMLRRGMRLAAEEMVERLSDPEKRKEFTPKDLAIVMGIFVDKHELLTGSATSRLVVETSNGSQSLDDYLRTMRKATRIDGEIPAQRGDVAALVPAQGDPDPGMERAAEGVEATTRSDQEGANTDEVSDA